MSNDNVSNVCSPKVVSSKTKLVTGTKRDLKESNINYEIKDDITT
jgi:hypothetical protein